MSLSVAQLLQTARKKLADVSDTAALDAELLLAHVLEVNRTWLFTWPEKVIPATSQQAFFELLEQREQGRPVAYLTGSQGFFCRDFAVSQATLIPRPDTELLVETALEKMASGQGALLDLGTGTGAIGITLALEKPGWVCCCVDASVEALAIAEKNATLLEAVNVSLVQSDWFAQLPDEPRFDLIVSNPPYIREYDTHLQQGDVRFEPLTALVAGADGLTDIRHIIPASLRYLKAGGWLMIEHGFDQAAPVRQLFDQHGFSRVESLRDLGGHERVTIGQYR